jgi:drug/metabolite transporter (DMT)-like permease
VNWQGLAFLLVVYVVWGSTYLGIRVAVRDGSGFPPFTMGATRAFVAGGVLLLVTALLRQRIRPTRTELWVLFVSGVLLWAGGNGLVAWAEQRADSGYAAVVVGSTPIWVAAIEAVLDRRRPSTMLIAALLLGLIGVAFLSVPALEQGSRIDAPTVVALFTASATWALGSVLQRRRRVTLGPWVSAAYQMLFGGVGYLPLIVLNHEPIPHPTPDAWLAWAYLVVFGSLVGFSSYVQVLHRLPTRLAMTYSYVNPVIAVLLGTVLLSEPLSAWTLAGVTLVLLGVAGVYRART